MSGAITSLVKSVLPEIGQSAGADQKGGDLASSFKSMLGGASGGGNEGSGGAAGGSAGGGLSAVFSGVMGGSMLGGILGGGGQKSESGPQGSGSQGGGAPMMPGGSGMLSEGVKAAFDMVKGDKGGASEAMHNMNPLTAISHDVSAMKDPNSTTSKLVHTALDVGGMVPGVGTATEGANAALYMAQRDGPDAALAGASAIPGAGDLVGAGRLGKDVIGLTKTA